MVRNIGLLFVLLSMFTGLAVAQPGGIEGQALRTESRIARFDADCIATRESDSTARVDVYVQIPYLQLAFIREGENYSAKYELTVQVRSLKDSVVKEKTFLESVIEPSYEATIGKSGKFVFLQKRIALPVGSYTVAFTISDINAHRPRTEVRSLTVAEYGRAPVSISSLLFADAIADLGTSRSITPHIGRDVSSMRQGTLVFFESYAARRDTMDIVYVCATISDRELVRGRRLPVVVEKGVSRHFFKAQTQQLSQGSYVMTVALVPHVADTNAAVELDSVRVKMTRAFVVEWGTGLPQTDEDIDRVVSQLRWIATQDEMDQIRSGTTIEAKRDAYARFWQMHDPTPGTLRNEAQELYMARIRYANEHYKGFGGEGYTSDQGMVYVIFGDPSSVESHPFDYVTVGMYHGPYVIWYYDRFNRNYLFIDMDGFGNYRLTASPPIERFHYGQ